MPPLQSPGEGADLEGSKTKYLPPEEDTDDEDEDEDDVGGDEVPTLKPVASSSQKPGKRVQYVDLDLPGELEGGAVGGAKGRGKQSSDYAKIAKHHSVPVISQASKSS